MSDSTTKRKRTTKPKATPDAQNLPAPVFDGTKALWTGQERQAVLARAWRGEDASVMPELQAMLDAHPETVRRLADKALSPVRALTSVSVSPANRPLFDEVFARRMAQMQAELEGSDPSPLERMLCQRVAVAWLALATLESADAGTADGTPLPIEWREHHDLMIARAHKRHLAACESLAKVRRLLRPLVAQVNVAQAGAQQLNVGTLPEGVTIPPANIVE